MAQKTYALFDLIGIKKAIAAEEAFNLLERFWNVADAWTNSQSFSPVSISGAGYLASPEVYVSTFSDSALLHTGQEIEISDFLFIVRDFKRRIDSQVCASYVIISRNDEIAQPAMPAIGAYLVNSTGVPRYVRVAGSGNAWINLHRADAALSKHKKWHGKYSIYGVGEQSRPSNSSVKESIECAGLLNATHIFAIE